jgi:5-methylcytosine-specific restriction protein A
VIEHWFNVAHNALRESAKRGNAFACAVTGEPARSDKWPTVEKHFKANNPRCAACNGQTRLNVHHVQPFHLRPELELDFDNLITLCMGPVECHLKIGHGDDFKAWNPGVREDAKTLLVSPELRPNVEQAAKASRMYDDPDATAPARPIVK